LLLRSCRYRLRRCLHRCLPRRLCSGLLSSDSNPTQHRLKRPNKIIDNCIPSWRPSQLVSWPPCFIHSQLLN
jgi:hypothetical protein